MGIYRVKGKTICIFLWARSIVINKKELTLRNFKKIIWAI
jgi:hypothetical protein